MVCKRCKKTIIGRYIKTDLGDYHTDCFVCERCNKKIDGNFQINKGRLLHTECFRLETGLICDYCGKVLGDSYKVYNNKKYHPDCFAKEIQMKCSICGKLIEGEYYRDEDGIYHKGCYIRVKLPLCDVCNKPIEDKRYAIDKWGNKAHLKHDGKDVLFCDSCGRIVAVKTSKGGIRYEDGRAICNICNPTAVKSVAAAQKILLNIINQFKEISIDNIPNNIAIELVDKKTIKKYSKAENVKGYASTSQQTLGGKLIKSENKILVLYGLNQLEFEGVAAHELLHIWLNNNRLKLGESDTEGFCNLGSFFIYNKSGTELASLLIDNLENNPDKIYGGGYRKMKKILDSKGWKGVHEYIEKNKMKVDIRL